MSNTVHDSITIKEARDLMRPLLKKGTTCLCCGLTTKLYTRSLTSSMIMGLILIYREDCRKNLDITNYDTYIHLEDFFKKLNIASSIRGDMPKLRFWGLLHPRGGVGDNGNPNDGYYMITAKGVDFVLGKRLVQKSVKIYNNTFRGFDGPDIDVHVAIKNKFNYSELMGGK